MLSPRRMSAFAIVVALASAAAGLSGLSSCAREARPLVAPANLDSIGLQSRWTFRVPLATGESIANVWRAGESLYITTTMAHLIRLNAASGVSTWETDLQNSSFHIFKPAETPDGKDVLVVNSGQAFLLDKDTGIIQKQNPLNIDVTTDPICVGNNMFCVGGVNYFYALYLDMLQGHRWVTPAKGDVFSASPALQADSILLASEQGNLWRVNLADGQWIWRDRKTNGRVVGGLAADARAAYIPCLDGNVYAFNMRDGAELWNTPLHGGLDKTLLLTRSEVIVPTGDHHLYALSLDKGEVKWTAEGIKDVGTMAGDRLWALNAAGDLQAFNIDTGAVEATAAVGGGSLVFNSVDKMVFLVNKSNVITGFSTGK